MGIQSVQLPSIHDSVHCSSGTSVESNTVRSASTARLPDASASVKTASLIVCSGQGGITSIGVFVVSSTLTLCSVRLAT